MDDGHVLVLEADAATLRILEGFLRTRGYPYIVATSIDGALGPLAQRSFRFSFVDLDIDGIEASDLIQRLKLHGEPGPIIGLTSNGHHVPDVEITASLTDGLVRKPFSHEDLESAIEEVGLARQAVTRQPRDDGATKTRQEMDLWRSPKMREIQQIIREAARVDVTVLITGETGTGKDVVARAIHHLSSRRNGPYVKVNCAAVPRELLESELFGHERGAFTGAHQLKVGKFEAAHRGTMFLDEIGDLHLALQAKLLHVLQDGDFSRVGGKSTMKVDVRVLAATNQDLERSVVEGRFREDLFYRLNVIQIVVPPLRERLEDIPALVDYFVTVYAKRFNREAFSLSSMAVERLLRHRYPGNVRELENLVKRMIVLGDPFLGRVPVPQANGEGSVERSARMPTLAESLKDIARRASLAAERDAICKVLDQTGWNRVRAAKALRVSYRALLYKMKQLGLNGERSHPNPSAWGRGRPDVWMP